MASMNLARVFSGQPSEEIHLERAPLDLVLLQVRVPSLTHLADEASVQRAISALKAELAGRYPLAEQQDGIQIMVEAGGPTSRQGPTVWILRDPKSSWRVSISPNSVALFTNTYTDRADFRLRAQDVLDSARNAFGTPTFARLGVRYVNRLRDEAALDKLTDLVRNEVMGGTTIDLPADVEIKMALSDWVFERENGPTLHVRSGFVPPQASPDPTVPGLDTRTWVLDCDAYSEDVSSSGDTALELFDDLARIDHEFFRWAILEDAFKSQFGGAGHNADD